MTYKLFILIIISVQLLSQTQNNFNDLTVKKIDQLFSHINKETPGYVIGIVKDTNLIFSKGYGSANLEYQIPITEESVFNIASLSKQFTAAAIALLMLEGKLSLDDNVNQFIDNFPTYDYDVKIKHLIYMTSGLKEYYQTTRTNKDDWSSLHFFNVDIAIESSLKQSKLEYKPGTKWTYSNINYMLLTKIIEKISEMSFSEYLHRNLFQPLKMNNSIVNDDIFQIIPHRANGYNYRDNENTDWLISSSYLKDRKNGFMQIHRNAPHYGGSGIFTSLNDLVKWLNNFSSKKFGGSKLYNLMHKRLKFDHNKSNDAFGLVFGDFNGHKTIWYEGGDWGFSSYMIRFPESKLSIVCLSNLGTGNSKQYVNRIIDILIEQNEIKL